jgi:hypothetical protein
LSDVAVANESGGAPPSLAGAVAEEPAFERRGIGGRYADRRRGVLDRLQHLHHLRGIAAMLIGMVAAAAWLNADPAWTSPFSAHAGGADLSVCTGALFGGAGHWLLNRRPVAVEVAQTDPLAEAAAATGVA